MAEQDASELKNMMNFLANAPHDEEIIAMDCNEHCEQLAMLAERVANGENLETILPELQKHMQFYGDCREEFEALVAVLKAEMLDDLPDLPAVPPDDTEQ